jgi:anti-anti-sigma factor
VRLVIERQTDDICLVCAVGEVDLQTVADLDSALVEVQAGGHTNVLLDLWDVTFIDSVGLGVLLSAKRRAQKGIGGFAIVAEPQGVVQTVFDLAGLSVAMPVYSTRAFATGTFRSSVP